MEQDWRMNGQFKNLQLNNLFGNKVFKLTLSEFKTLKGKYNLPIQPPNTAI